MYVEYIVGSPSLYMDKVDKRVEPSDEQVIG